LDLIAFSGDDDIEGLAIFSDASATSKKAMSASLKRAMLTGKYRLK